MSLDVVNFSRSPGRAVEPLQRFKRSRRCPICGGWDEAKRGQGRRCFGFLSTDGEYAHCTREEYAGRLPLHPTSQTYAHRLSGQCQCGDTHGLRTVDPHQLSRRQYSGSRAAHLSHRGQSTARNTTNTETNTEEITYDYRNESGILVHQVVRRQAHSEKGRKTFTQRRPDGRGGWIYNLSGVTRVLYRLPELRMADRSSIVYIAEGEKDVDNLSALGLVATTSSGGAGNWKVTPNADECLRDRHVAILPDNDGPGRKHARDVAADLYGVAASVRIVDLPDLPDAGDVSDWLERGGSMQQLAALVAETPLWIPTPQELDTLEPDRDEEDREDSVPLGADGVSPFPASVLPGVFRRIVEEGAVALNCPPDFLGVPLLALVGAAIGTSRVLEIKPDWIESACLWVGLVAPPGNKKSPALDLVKRPFERRQRELVAEYREALQKYRGTLAQYEDESDAWKRSQSLGEGRSRRRPQKPELPTMHHVMITDATLEALVEALTRNLRGLLFLRDELTAWVAGMNQYRNGKGADRQHWLSLWNSAQINVIRKQQQEPMVLTRPFVSVVGALPPAVLGMLSNELGEDGFIHRILLAYPDRLPGKWTEDSVSASTLQQYDDAFTRLWALEPRTDQHADLVPVRVPFTREGKESWVAWITEHYAEQDDPRFPEHLRSPWSKMEGYCARLALILQECRVACGEVATEEVDAISVAGARNLIQYFKSHARRIYFNLHASPKEKQIADTMDWIQRHGGRASVREVQQSGVAGVRTSDDARELLTLAADRGYGTLEEVPGRGRQRQVFTISPRRPTPDNKP